MDWVADVEQFQKRFGFSTPAKPEWPAETTVQVRTALITEELLELCLALARRDLPETADALADLIYVLVGTALSFGIDLRPVWEEVHRSNMAKQGGEVQLNGKIAKPAGWQPPDIVGALARGCLDGRCNDGL